MKLHPTVTNDALIIASADHFEISLFLGTGKFAKAEAKTIEEARKEAARILDANPTTSRRPIIYAVTAAGRTAPIT